MAGSRSRDVALGDVCGDTRPCACKHARAFNAHPHVHNARDVRSTLFLMCSLHSPSVPISRCEMAAPGPRRNSATKLGSAFICRTISPLPAGRSCISPRHVSTKSQNGMTKSNEHTRRRGRIRPSRYGIGPRRACARQLISKRAPPTAPRVRDGSSMVRRRR